MCDYGHNTDTVINQLINQSIEQSYNHNQYNPSKSNYIVISMGICIKYIYEIQVYMFKKIGFMWNHKITVCSSTVTNV